ncbi:hypothetical protein D3C72_1911680 [compost metagenome]
MLGVQLAHKPRQRQRHAFDVHLGLHAGRPFGQRQAPDARTARHAQRLQGGVERVRHGLRGIGVDDKEGLFHSSILGKIRRQSSCAAT